MTEIVVARKVAELRARIARVRTLLPASVEAFLAHQTEAEALVLNLYLALQACSDLAMHLVSDRGLGAPGDARGAYDLLGRDGLLAPDLARRLAAAVGMRNRIAHEYGNLDLALVYVAARDDLRDLEDLARAAAESYRLGE